jgi:hypothetical protein
MPPYTLIQLNNQYVEIDGLIDGATKFLGDGVTLNPFPTYINSGTGTVQIKDPTNALVVIGPASATSVNASYVVGSNGDYRFLITSAFNPQVLGQGYTIIVDLTAPGGFVGHWELPAQVNARRI